jgi:hypothetical protein
MPQLVEYADELVTRIGPRPGGSKGEHQAAETIAANLEGLGLDTWIQEFSTARGVGWVRVLYYLLGVIAAEVLFAYPGLAILSFILALISAALLVLDLLGMNPLYGLFNKGLSQNVVSRYVPSGADPRRKVIIVAHYDSGRSMIQCAPFVASYYVLIRQIIRYAVLALALVALFSLLPLPELLVLVLSVIGLIIGIALLLAAIIEVVNLFLPYNQGANCNASGVAAMMGVAETLVGVRSPGAAAPGRRTRGARSTNERTSAAERGGAYAPREAEGGYEDTGYDEYDADASADTQGRTRGGSGARAAAGIGGAAPAAGTAKAAPRAPAPGRHSG